MFVFLAILKREMFSHKVYTIRLEGISAYQCFSASYCLGYFRFLLLSPDKLLNGISVGDGGGGRNIVAWDQLHKYQLKNNEAH